MKLVCASVCGWGRGWEESARLVLRQLYPFFFFTFEYIKCSLGMGKLHAKMSTPQSMQQKSLRTRQKPKTCLSGGSGNKTSKDLFTMQLD